LNRLVTHLVDGQPNDSLPVTNRGLAYGDGVFETILFNKLIPVLWQEHLERLFHACHILGLNLPDDIGAEWLRSCVQLLEQNQKDRAVIKIMIVRGSGERGYRSLPDAAAHSIISMLPAPEIDPACYVDGMKLWVCKSRLSRNPLLAGIKHLNRLEQVMAAREWPDESFHEGLMLDVAGNIVEGTRSNPPGSTSEFVCIYQVADIAGY
jgi:4-amino-4-deoxychorismate lyase